jgi:hypothetical protein
MFDGEELARIEEVYAGGAALVLGMIKTDMEWQAKRTEREETRHHNVRLLTIWLTFGIVVFLGGMATVVTVTGHPWVGGILAGVNLVALATVFLNAGRRKNS